MRGSARLRGWNAAVAVSVIVLAVPALALGVGWLVSHDSPVTGYSVAGALKRVELRLSSGRAVIVGTSSPVVQVRREEDYAFGHRARERRSVSAGVLRIASECPRVVVGNCSASYELAVPESVAIDIRTTRGEVQVTDYRGAATLQTRSGQITVEAYCGFNLSAASESGSMRLATACSPQRLTASTRSGTVVARVPPGRYRINASSGIGRERIRGLTPSASAPFAIDVRSGRGSVTVEAGL